MSAHFLEDLVRQPVLPASETLEAPSWGLDDIVSELRAARND